MHRANMHRAPSRSGSSSGPPTPDGLNSAPGSPRRRQSGDLIFVDMTATGRSFGSTARTLGATMFIDLTSMSTINLTLRNTLKATLGLDEPASEDKVEFSQTTAHGYIM
jgi:hypothetical protein